MREVEDDVNRRAASPGQQPPKVQLTFTMRVGVDYKRFNLPVCNESCAVFTLNADHSFLSN